MKKLNFCLLTCLSALGALFANQPNIIFILCDDLGYGDLGATGHPYVKSPNIDRLAAEGIRFEHGYMSGAWCSPSRASLMTGLYPSRYFNHTLEMDTDGETVFSILKGAGYKTAHFGKWHMSGKQRNDPTPDMYGVDEYFIHNGNGEAWTRDERGAPHWRESTTKRYVDLTIEFLERNKDSEQPLYVNLWVYPTHSYIDPTPEMLDWYKDLEFDINDFENPLQREFLEWIGEQGSVEEAMRGYCSDVTDLDNHVGRLMAKLKDLGVDEDTVVIFSSDNGPAPLGPGTNQLADRIKERPTLINCVGSSGPFRDRKISLHDGGTRVPYIARWPGKIPAGSVNSETVITGVDFLPTMAALGRAQLPETPFDGVNMLAAYEGEKFTRPGPHFWNDRPGWSAVRENQWKAHLRRKKFRLFNILEDPSESSDVSSEFPEVAEHYTRLLENFESEVKPKR
ncbi:MAG: sulfatase-like hydrolase/transferase [Verrucomicrobiota bacterium]